MEQSIELLKKELTNKTLLDQLILQVNKDFYRAIQEEAVPSNASIIEVITNIEIHVKKIINETPNKLETLLYLIDVPETEIHKFLKENPDNIAEVISYLILKRECLKVYFRNKI